jgi:hypothetical protein
VSKRPPTIARKRLAYRRALCGEKGKTPHLDGQIILEDLRKVAKIDNGSLVVSPKQGMTDIHATMYRAGLRDMYLRFAFMLGFDEADTFDTSEEIANESART